ncbi:MAG: hypothetical protein HOG73_09980 [Candidatus Marinimicrobia bacterium]|jgi:hypothetical protein|nr:hypothetical protein [Candidatus Neomarinimicrobiota bacterium]MBT5068617.1 hypothetical protein [Candidatus Neomarinimicrobiota bacterium]MBT5996039.1 hypothetical protein [Candidatus Neomarinimicrobiota bacterium]MBT6929699.1 hypothetical protein [Candidatus Neomarinimicrobiota bacterium]MBT7973231.1 hypothetical protein [Candidatus Neomarinimicrobiota bacterium]
MEEHTNDRNHLEITEEHANRLEQLELETKGMVAASKVWIYVIIGLLVYMVFMVIPDIDEKVTWMEKDLNSVLVQSERFKKATRVFAKDNQCSSCHLSPDYLLHNLLLKYPSFSDIKSFMLVGHQRYYTMTTPIADEELLAIYRALQ